MESSPDPIKSLINCKENYLKAIKQSIDEISAIRADLD